MKLAVALISALLVFLAESASRAQEADALSAAMKTLQTEVRSAEPAQPGAADQATPEPLDLAQLLAPPTEVAKEPELDPKQAAFHADLVELTATPHRLSGTEEGLKAASTIERRLRQIGLTNIVPLGMQVWQPRTLRCELTVDGVAVRLFPLRPNVTVLPVTPPEGVTGPLVYVGPGSLEDYRDRSVRGAIVVLDYASTDEWHRAFALGAKAVVFVGRGDETPVGPKRAGVPSNLLRFYAPEQTLGGVDLMRDRTSVKLVSDVIWQSGTGRNIVARIPGTDPGFALDRDEPEALVLATHYDSFGEVPELVPGARAAANVAALLEAAAAIQASPPRRDVVLMFLDNQAHYHQGAREVYDALQMSEDQHDRLVTEHRQEQKQLISMHRLLGSKGLQFQSRDGTTETVVGLRRGLADQANYARDDTRKELLLLRLGQRTIQGMPNPRIRELDAKSLRWDELRRALHKNALAGFVRQQRRNAEGSDAAAATGKLYLSLFEELRARTLARFERRLGELERITAIDAQRSALRRALTTTVGDSVKPLWIVLHATFNFSDAGATWGVVAGDWTHRFFSWRAAKGDADAPGYYGRVLNALSDAARGVKGLQTLDRRTLSDPSLGLTFAPGPFVSSGAAAGGYGLYNVSLMTGYDSRPRDGHPADTLEALDWRTVERHARDSVQLLRALGNSTAITLPPVFKSQVRSKYPSFDRGQVNGDYAGLQVSGSLKEDRPAAGALVGVWPGNSSWKNQAWQSLVDALDAPGFDPVALESVDENGRFRNIGLREDLHVDVMTLATVQDARGEVLAITSQATQSQRLTEAMRINLIFGTGHGWTVLPTSKTNADLLKVLDATSNAPFRENRALWGQLRDESFVFVSDQVVGYRLKLFQPLGVAALGSFTDQRPFGTGIAPAEFGPGIRLSHVTANDLWRLNELRLGELRARGVTNSDLELLHSRARRSLDQAGGTSSVAVREASLARSAALSQHVYLPLRAAMDDLVHAIVLLLLLAIPFAFALERLILGATSIYGRIAGFGVAFIATFGLLYWLHPGFAIASTPTIIFLAFAIVLLSSLVIYIVVRKFKTELRAMQGQAHGVHGLEVSRMGTLLAAVGMGMSTMRRRKMRTTLTAITVVILTFTILSFASFSRVVGVRATYEGPPNERTRSRLLLRKLDYSSMERGVLDLLRGQEGPGGLISGHYWLARQAQTTERFSVTRPDTGESLTLDAVMGVPTQELERWPELAEVLGDGETRQKIDALDRGDVFLPAIVRRLLKLEAGDPVLLNGHRVRFAGSIAAAGLERLKHLDGQSILPVDFNDPVTAAVNSSTASAQQDETQLILADEVDRNFVHLTSDQVAVASSHLVRQLGGELHSVSVYPGEGVEPAERGRRLAELVVMPVWASGSDGVDRLVFTVLTEVSGGLALFVPLLLGGLIIFGTLLGSISDREREIYTFSALGLSPGHVGALFLAEAAVYAVIGGMGGQLMAQFVALGAGSLARAGIIEPTSINYSSTNSLFAIGVVMLTVLVSAIYPAVRASKSANPGVARTWKMPSAQGDALSLIFPFTVSAYDITGVVSFLAEHFRHHDDAGLGDFAASRVRVDKTPEGNLALAADVALAPFDLGVTQRMQLSAIPSEIEGVDEVAIDLVRTSGAQGDWHRANRVFVKNLRRQFLLWRTLSNEMIEHYRMQTLEELGAARDDRDAPLAMEAIET